MIVAKAILPQVADCPDRSHNFDNLICGWLSLMTMATRMRVIVTRMTMVMVQMEWVIWGEVRKGATGLSRYSGQLQRAGFFGRILRQVYYTRTSAHQSAVAPCEHWR
jgi:hypothetical protein